MNRYFFCQRTDSQFNRIGQTYALNRYFASILFSIRKGIKLREFLSIYAVYNFPTFDLKCARIKITHQSDKGELNSVTYTLNQKTKIWQCLPAGRLERKCFLMFKAKYNYNKFIQFIAYLQKESDYTIFFDNFVSYDEKSR